MDGVIRIIRAEALELEGGRMPRLMNLKPCSGYTGGLPHDHTPYPCTLHGSIEYAGRWYCAYHDPRRHPVQHFQHRLATWEQLRDALRLAGDALDGQPINAYWLRAPARAAVKAALESAMEEQP